EPIQKSKAFLFRRLLKWEERRKFQVEIVTSVHRRREKGPRANICPQLPPALFFSSTSSINLLLLLFFQDHITLEMSGHAQCFNNPPILNPSYSAGEVEELAGFQTYVTGSPDSNLAILLIHDAFGYEAPNLRKLADKVASSGFFVVVPDLLYGDPADLGNPQFDPQAWLATHPSDKGCEDAKKVIAELRSRGFSAIGAAGFCWGGMVLVKLASGTELLAGVILHPGPITVDEINAVRIPTAILGAENDHIFPADQLEQLGHVLATKSGQVCYVKIFPGVSHGWTMKYKEDDDSAVKVAEEAHLDMLNWFLKYVRK
ncbi:unnamed protein product, partial [Linum tenue]